MTSWKNAPLLYTTWEGMLRRCYSPRCKHYKYYGGRGIKVCPEWRHDFKRFQDDMLPTYKKGLTLDRKDGDKDYSPQNCRWATRKQQQRNQKRARKVVIEGKTYLVADLIEQSQRGANAIIRRAKAGLTLHEVLNMRFFQTPAYIKGIQKRAAQRRLRSKRQ